MRGGSIVALVCFVSLALLGWYGLVFGWSWEVALSGLWFLVLGALAGVPADWERKK